MPRLRWSCIYCEDSWAVAGHGSYLLGKVCVFCLSSEAAGRKSNFEVVLKHLCKNIVLSLYVIASICMSRVCTLTMIWRLMWAWICTARRTVMLTWWSDGFKSSAKVSTFADWIILAIKMMMMMMMIIVWCLHAAYENLCVTALKVLEVVFRNFCFFPFAA